MANTDLNGFSVDAPNVVVKTAQGDYSTVTASEATITFAGDTIKIAGGQGFYSIAEIDKSKTIEIKIIDAQYSAQSHALSTGAVITKGADTYDVYGEVFTADATGLITLPKIAIAKSLRINGFTEVDIAPITAGTFMVTISADSTAVLFTVAEAGVSFSPLYSVAVNNAVTVTGLTTSFPKSGEVRFTYPLYSDVLAEESTIIGDIQITIYKCKIVQGYKAGGGVKSAQTFDLNLSAIDGRRPDKQMWKSVFIPLSADTTAPTIISVVPANSSTGIVASAPIVWTFSEAINPALVNTSNFIVLNSVAGTNPAGVFTMSANNSVVTFQPTVPLTALVKYFATVTADVTDVAGNRLATNSTTSFTVA